MPATVSNKWFVTLLLVISCLFLLLFLLRETPGKVKYKESIRGTPYCLYQGKITGVYLNNKDDLILLFLEDEINAEDAINFGYKIHNSNAVAISISENFEFAQLTFELLNDAFMQNNEVKIHARGVYKGYLLLDRVWVNK